TQLSQRNKAKMWKLRLSQGDDEWVKSANNHVGRQFWEFDPNLGTLEERTKVDKARQEFYDNRHNVKHSSDLLMRLQFERERPLETKLPQVKVGSEEDITVEAATITLRRALKFYSTIQAEDGFWPGDYAGPLFLIPGLVIGLSVMGNLNQVLSEEHQREIRRYLYNHQNAKRVPTWKQVLNMVCCWVEDPKSTANKMHISRIKDFLWVAEDGMKMQGYNGSQLWDASFAVQAICATKLVSEYGSMLKKTNEFIKISQVEEDSSSNLSSWYRHISKGGWTFSTRDHGWPVTDSSAEGFKAALILSKMPFDIVGEAIAPQKLYDAVDLTLSLQVRFHQNSNGGFASFEKTRSYPWLEVINPAETFGDIIIDYSYTECTSAEIQSLRLFMDLYPGYRRKEIMACVAKGANYIESRQLPDGSWLVFFPRTTTV
ncbi:hypothetical protein RJ639_005470, partial [Escallonia herrerae]